MLHDAMLSGAAKGTLADERRSGARTTTVGEIVLAWHHDPAQNVRYPLLELSDGGLRIRSSTPLLGGMTGTVLRRLPDGKALDRPIMVAWVDQADDGGGRSVGLRFLQP